ncbi:unnamed protein product, partial [Rotaria sp. Silwood1]
MTTQTNIYSQCRNKLINYIKNLNLYDDHEDLNLVDQLLSTRVFIILLFLSLLIILSLTIIIPQTRFITVNSPSSNDFEILFNSYTTKVLCQCSQTSIPYSQFVSLNPQFHQICSSDFISEQWFSSLFNINTINYYPLDFRLIASSQFQVLSILCKISRQAVNDALRQFITKTIISSNALSPDVLNTSIDMSIEQLKKNTLDSYRLYYYFILSLISEYRFKSALRTNFYTRNVPDSNIFETFSGIYPKEIELIKSSFLINETCRCDKTNDCIYPAGIYNKSRSIIPNEVFSFDTLPLFIIPGFQVGCLPLNALFQSTLECFYNQSCLNILISLTNALQNVSPLNISNSFSKFNPKTTIAVLFDNLMVESWDNSTNFGAYFQTCAPKTCSYSYEQRFYLIYLITTIASIFGGIRVVLYTLSPLFVKFILRLCRRRTLIQQTQEQYEPKQSFQTRILNILKLIRDKILTLNLFKTTFTEVQHGIYATRIYIILLMFGIFILTIYSTRIIISQQIIVQNPSLNEFEHLYNINALSLSCPCQNSLIQRSKFISIQVKLHPFCSSNFIRDDRWFQYWTMTFLNGTIDLNPPFYWIDFRKNGWKFFNYVKILCDFFNVTLYNMMNSSQQEYFFSSQPIIQLEFNKTIDNWKIFLQSQITNIYTDKLQPVEESIKKSGAISFDFMNPLITKQINNKWILEYAEGNTDDIFNTSCYCQQFVSCLKPLGFYCYPSSCTQIIIPNLFIGCQSLDITSSTLECFYEESCVQMLINYRLYGYENIYLPIDLSNIKALDPNEIIAFRSEDTLGVIKESSFLNQWIYTVKW